jgi:hypothetical protein
VAAILIDKEKEILVMGLQDVIDERLKGDESLLLKGLPRQLAIEPCFRQLPVTFYGDDRNAEHLGNLFHRQPAEVT